MAETSTLRRIIGIFTGMVVGAFTTGVLQSIGHHVAPLPDSVDPSDTETMRAALAEAPPEAETRVVVPTLARARSGFPKGYARTRTETRHVRQA